MQKKIIALAVAALASSAAFAQTNVTVYGIADASITATSTLGDEGAATQTVYKVNSGTLSTSRIGFKGVEDLGNGLKALFTLEYGLAIDEARPVGYSTTTSATARQQFVGLTGGFGTVVAGHLQTTGLDFTLAGSALGASSSLGATNVVETGSGGLMASANTHQISAQAGGRHQNAVAYISPSFGGLTIAYNHARVTESANTTGTSDTHGQLLSASYANGPITAGAIFTRVTQPGEASVAPNITEWGLRAGYDFQVVKLQATYQRAKVQEVDADSKWVVSVSAPVGAKAAVIAEYAHVGVNSTAGDDNVNAATLAATYSLSKRTTAYAGYNSISRNNGVNVTVTGYQNGPAANLVSGADTGTFVVGMNHKF